MISAIRAHGPTALIALIAGAVLALGAARATGNLGPHRPEPAGVNAMRLNHPAVVAGMSAAEVGDKLAETVADIRHEVPAQILVNRARVRWGTTGQDETLQVVYTVWSVAGGGMPGPNLDGAVDADTGA